MTLKYESELLFDLMKRDGDGAPSDVLPYESELKEKYLNQVVGAYPKLQDYRPEWLNYNLYHHIPSEFPVESVANVTSASFNNVVPYAYKSAILKGKTLENLINNSNEEKEIGVGNSTPAKYNYIYPLTNSKEYTVQFEIVDFNADNPISFSINNGSNAAYTTAPINKNGIYKFKTTLNKDNASEIWFYWSYGNYNSEYTGKVKNIVVLDGDYTNIDIPYFERMTSVKMPVLCTTGKNLCDTSKYIHAGISNTIMVFSKNKYRSYYMKCKPSTVYTVKVENSNNRFGVASSHLFNEDTPFKLNNYLLNGTADVTGKTLECEFTTTEKDKYLYVYVANNGVFNPNIKVQVEESSTATPYEPFKSNILTVNEDVTLRGIGEVQDELNLLTGELTQRVGEAVYTEKEIWYHYLAKEFDNSALFSCTSLKIGDTGDSSMKTNFISDRFTPSIQIYVNDIIGSYIQNGSLFIRVKKEWLTTPDVYGLQRYLQQNPITVQYPLKEEVIKTVDLTVTDQDGITESTIRPIEGTMHVNTSSQTLPPLLDMGVPVEATTQNLMSFANIEAEE